MKLNITHNFFQTVLTVMVSASPFPCVYCQSNTGLGGGRQSDCSTHASKDDGETPSNKNMNETSSAKQTQFLERFERIGVVEVGRKDSGGAVVSLNVHVKNVDLEGIEELTELRELSLGRTISHKGLEHLKELKQLRTLYLNVEGITDTGLKELEKLEELRVLGLRNITDTGLEYLRNLKKLEALDLSGNKKITGTGLEYVNALKKLRKLNWLQPPLRATAHCAVCL
jgi:Leucine-rich repeat (LRR) protein